jgi:Ca-activated chloride channel family protein
MTFSHPWVLLLLLIPAALAAWEVFRRHPGHRVALPIDHARARPRRILARTLSISALFAPFALASIILILAGPQRLGPPGQARVLTSIELLLDVSGSMSSPVGYGKSGASRYTAAMDAITQFTSRRKGDAFGLTIFGGEVVRWVPLTKDLSAIKNATPFLDPATMPAPLNSTRVGHALLYARDVLTTQPETAGTNPGSSGIDASAGDRLVILITDGFSSDLEGGAAQQIGTELRDSGIVVHAINVGEPPAPSQLAEVVAPTGGRVFDAADPSSLKGIFDHIDQMHPARSRPTQPEPIDNFTPFALAGLALLALHGLCLLTLRITPW